MFFITISLPDTALIVHVFNRGICRQDIHLPLNILRYKIKCVTKYISRNKDSVSRRLQKNSFYNHFLAGPSLNALHAIQTCFRLITFKFLQN